MANVQIQIKSSAQTSGLTSVNAALKTMTINLTNLTTSTKTLGSTITSVGKSATSALGSATSAAGSFKTAASSAGSAASSSFSHAAGAAQTVGSAITGASSQITRAEGAVRQYEEVWRDVSFSIANNLTNTVMSKIQELAASVPRFFQGATNVAAEFEDSMQEFEASSGSAVFAAGKSLQDFEKLVLDIGARLPITVLDAQRMMIDMAKGGLNVLGMFGDETAGSMGTLESTINFMSAGFVTAERAAEISAKLMGQWRDATNTVSEDTAQLISMQDTMVRAANTSTTSVDELFLGMTNAAGAARSAGVSFDEFAGIMAFLESGFSNASTAGTGLRWLFNGLQPSTQPAIDAFYELGWMGFRTQEAMDFLRTNGIQPLSEDQAILTDQLYDYAFAMGMTESEAKKFLQDFNISKFFSEEGEFKGVRAMMDAFAPLQELLESGDNAKLMQLTKTIFGEDGKQAVSTLLTKGGRIGFDEYMQAMQEANGVAQTAAIVQQGYEFAMEQFQGTMETLTIQLGLKLLPVMGELVTIGGEVIGMFLGQEDSLQRIKEAIPNVYAFMNQLVGEAFQYIITIVPKIAEGVASLIPVIVDQFRRMGSDIVTSMNIILPEWEMIIAGMTGALLVFAGPSVIGLVKTAIGGISTALMTARGNVLAFFASLGPLLPLAIAVGVAAAVVANNWGALEKAFNDAGGGINGAAAAISTLGTIIGTWIEQELPVLLLQLGDQAVLLWKWIEDSIPPTLQRFNRWWGTVVDWMGTQLPYWRQQLVDWALALWQWVVDAIPSAVGELTNWWNTIVAYVTGQLPVWGSTLLSWATALWNWIVEGIPTTEATLQTWWNNLVVWVNTQLPVWRVQFDTWRDTLFSWIINSGPQTIAQIQGWYRNLESWILESLPSWIAAFTNWTDPLWNFIVGAASFISPELGAWLTNLRTTLAEKIPEWAASFVAWRDNLWKWIQESWPEVSAKIQGWWNTLTSGVNALYGEWGPKFVTWRDNLWKWIQESWPEVSAKIQGWWNTLTSGVSALYGEWGPKFVTWGQELWKWIVNASNTVVPKLQEFFATIVRWTQMRPEDLAVEFMAWAVESYEWIKTASDQSLVDLGEWLNEILDWIITEAPTLRAKFATWVRETTFWILNAIEPALLNFSTWLGDITIWIAENADDLALGFAEWSIKTVSWIILSIPAAIGALGVFLTDIVNWVSSNLGNWERNINKFGEAMTAVFGLPTQEESARELAAWGNSINAFVAAHAPDWEAAVDVYRAKLIGTIANAAAEWPGKWQEFQNRILDHVRNLGTLIDTATGGFVTYMVDWITYSITSAQHALDTWWYEFLSFMVSFLPGWARTMLGFGMESHKWIIDAIPDLLVNVGIFFTLLQTAVLNKLQGWVDQWAPFASGAVQWLRDAMNPMAQNVGDLLTGAENELRKPANIQKIENGVAPLGSLAAMWPSNATPLLNTNATNMITSAGNTIANSQSIIDERLAMYTTAASTTYSTDTMATPASAMIDQASSAILSTGASLRTDPSNTVSPYYSMRTSASTTYSTDTMATPASAMIDQASSAILSTGASLRTDPSNAVSPYYSMRTSASTTYSTNIMATPASAMINQASSAILSTGASLRTDPSNTVSPYYNMRVNAQQTFRSDDMSTPASAMIENTISSINTEASPLLAGYSNPISTWGGMKRGAQGAFGASDVSTPAGVMMQNGVSAIQTKASPLLAGYSNPISTWGGMKRGAQGAFGASDVSTPAGVMVQNATDKINAEKADIATAFSEYTSSARNTFNADTMTGGAFAMVDKIGKSFRSTREGNYGSIVSNSMQVMGADGVTRMSDEFKNDRTTTNEGLRAATRAWSGVQRVFRDQIRARFPDYSGTGAIGPGMVQSGAMSGAGAVALGAMSQNTTTIINNNNTIVNFTPQYHGSGGSPSTDVALARIMSKV